MKEALFNTNLFFLYRYDKSENFLTTTFPNRVVNDFASSIYFRQQVIITIILNLKCMEFLRTKIIFVQKNLKALKASRFSLSVNSYDIFATKSFILQPKFVYIRVWVLYFSSSRSCYFLIVGNVRRENKALV